MLDDIIQKRIDEQVKQRVDAAKRILEKEGYIVTTQKDIDAANKSLREQIEKIKIECDNEIEKLKAKQAEEIKRIVEKAREQDKELEGYKDIIERGKEWDGFKWPKPYKSPYDYYEWEDEARAVKPMFPWADVNDKKMLGFVKQSVPMEEIKRMNMKPEEYDKFMQSHLETVAKEKIMDWVKIEHHKTDDLLKAERVYYGNILRKDAV